MSVLLGLYIHKCVAVSLEHVLCVQCARLILATQPLTCSIHKQGVRYNIIFPKILLPYLLVLTRKINKYCIAVSPSPHPRNNILPLPCINPAELPPYLVQFKQCFTLGNTPMLSSNSMQVLQKPKLNRIILKYFIIIILKRTPHHPRTRRISTVGSQSLRNLNNYLAKTKNFNNSRGPLRTEFEVIN